METNRLIQHPLIALLGFAAPSSDLRAMECRSQRFHNWQSQGDGFYAYRANRLGSSGCWF
jgi:hypothetical protein